MLFLFHVLETARATLSASSQFH